MLKSRTKRDNVHLVIVLNQDGSYDIVYFQLKSNVCCVNYIDVGILNIYGLSICGCY